MVDISFADILILYIILSPSRLVRQQRFQYVLMMQQLLRWRYFHVWGSKLKYLRNGGIG